ncbi:MAG TPA: hypothetical protein VNL71_01350, partial [Chloroflexota bacterium]|nr:hypothetical protein [Chloroflexota bacterium]
MPVILLSVDANTGGATAGIDRVVGGLNTMGAALDRTTTATNALDAALARATTTLETQLAMWARAEAATTTATDAIYRFGTALDSLGGSSATLLSSLDGQVSRLGAVTGASDAVTASIRAQASAYDLLAASQRAANANIVGNTAGRTVASDLAAAESSRLGNAGKVLGGAAVSDVGLLGRVGSAALGPEGLAVGAGLYAGFKTMQAASDYWSTVAQTAAQSNMPQSQVRPFGQGILDYAASGKSPYSASTIAQGAEQYVSAGYNVNTYGAAYQGLSQLSAQNAAPDLTGAIKTLNLITNAMGSGKNSTSAQVQQALDFISRAETLTSVQPGAITTSIPRPMSAAMGTGLSMEDIMGMFLKIAPLESTPRMASFAEAQLITSMSGKP